MKGRRPEVLLAIKSNGLIKTVAHTPRAAEQILMIRTFGKLPCPERTAMRTFRFGGCKPDNIRIVRVQAIRKPSLRSFIFSIPFSITMCASPTLVKLVAVRTSSPRFVKDATGARGVISVIVVINRSTIL